MALTDSQIFYYETATAKPTNFGPVAKPQFPPQQNKMVFTFNEALRYARDHNKRARFYNSSLRVSFYFSDSGELVTSSKQTNDLLLLIELSSATQWQLMADAKSSARQWCEDTLSKTAPTAKRMSKR